MEVWGGLFAPPGHLGWALGLSQVGSPSALPGVEHQRLRLIAGLHTAGIEGFRRAALLPQIGTALLHCYNLFQSTVLPLRLLLL